MSVFWERVGGYLERGERVFVACVAESTRGSPGTAGAKLLAAEGGELFGTVGGGMMEHRLVEQARELLRSSGAQPEKRTLVHSDTAEGEQSGMVCEGSQTNVFCVLSGDRDRATASAIAAAVREDRPAWIAVDAHGLQLVERDADLARPPYALTGEGERWRYEEDLLNRRRLAVIGGGHCAVALAEA
ncbi:MAG: XdhC family protein, partial [Spirochaetaceae bacterium]|nr:XdhC family protein [Spirochaetaceae bacterium]